MSEKPLVEVSQKTGVSRFTLAQVAREGRFGKAAKQYGRSWLIDIEHEDFKAWLVAHAHQPRVKGGKITAR